MTDLALAYISHGMENIAGQLSSRSRRVYAGDANVFADWLHANDIALEQINYVVISQWRGFLQEHYAPATAKRMWSVTRRILDEQVRLKRIASNPAKEVPGFKAEDESPHIALTLQEARDLLAQVDTTTLKGKRDYALLSLLLRTGLRRFECAALTIGDLGMASGHHVLSIQHGKGNKRRIAKVPVDVHRSIAEYLEATKRTALHKSAPLFIQFRKGDHPVEAPISDHLIARTVHQYAGPLHMEKLSPHGLRTSFVTLSLEGGATLQEVQYAAGHADPRTTEGYQRRKLNLDRNAVDFIHL